MPGVHDDELVPALRADQQTGEEIFLAAPCAHCGTELEHRTNSRTLVVNYCLPRLHPRPQGVINNFEMRCRGDDPVFPITQDSRLFLRIGMLFPSRATPNVLAIIQRAEISNTDTVLAFPYAIPYAQKLSTQALSQQ